MITNIKDYIFRFRNIIFSVLMLGCLITLACIFVNINEADVLSASESSSDAVANYKFDFGSRGIPGYTNVDATTSYNSERGYGFNSYWDVNEATNSVSFKDFGFKSNNTFNVDLPVGLYEIKVTLGKDIRTNIAAEGMLQLINLTGDFATDSFCIPITDGQLNITATHSKNSTIHSISELEIRQISKDPTMKRTIWICGDSTSCNYYPKTKDTRAGIGEVLEYCVDTEKYDIRNMASSGQTAIGFVRDGQFEPIEHYGKKDDYLIIAMGINDTHHSNEKEYYTVVKDMVQRAKAKGMIVYLVEQQGRLTDVDKKPRPTNKWFNSTLEKISKETDVNIIDLFNKALDYFNSIGYDATKAYYDDKLHFNKKGALFLADIVAKEMHISNNKDINDITTSSNATSNITFESSDNPEGIYYIQNENSKLFLDVENNSKDNGVNVRQWTYNGSNSQKFKLVRDGDGYYQILTGSSDYKSCLDIENYSKDDNANIMQYECYNGNMQKFRLRKNDDNSYSVLTRVTNLSSVVEVFNNETNAGSNVVQWTDNNGTNQHWRLVPTS